MDEPKNPYESYQIIDKVTGKSPRELYQQGYSDCESYLRSLVGEKGREALAKNLYELCHPIRSLEWSELSPSVRNYYEEKTDSLFPIIGAQIAAREEAIREEGRQEVVEWINENHGHCIATLEYLAINDSKWQEQLKIWGQV